MAGKKAPEDRLKDKLAKKFGEKFTEIKGEKTKATGAPLVGANALQKLLTIKIKPTLPINIRNKIPSVQKTDFDAIVKPKIVIAKPSPKNVPKK